MRNIFDQFDHLVISWTCRLEIVIIINYGLLIMHHIQSCDYTDSLPLSEPRRCTHAADPYLSGVTRVDKHTRVVRLTKLEEIP